MVYNLQAILCFVAPYFLGTDLLAMMLLVFAVGYSGKSPAVRRAPSCPW
jgi:hypothetical protein